jgi:hypothetical protein
MARTSRTLAVLVPLLALSGTAVAYGDQHQAPPPRSASYVHHLTATPAGFHQVDNSPSGDSAGDEVVDTFALSHEGKRVGTLQQYCVLTDADRGLAQCSGSMLLKSGRLTFGGAVTGSNVTLMPVLGGTKRYASSSGTLVFTPHGDAVKVDLRLRGVR